MVRVSAAQQRSKITGPRYQVTEPDRDIRWENLEDMIADERKILPNERINIVVEYAYLGQEPKPEKYIGRPRYIKASRHGKTRLAKRSARRDDLPPPEEKMIVYDDEAAQLLHGEKYAFLRKPGTVEEVKPTDDPKNTMDEPIDEDEHGKEHSRDSGCPVSPADKRDDKKEGSCSRGSEEKENRKRRSPEMSSDENSTSGTSHFIVKGSTPLTVIRRLLERKRQIHEGLRLELIDSNCKSNLDEKWSVADLANQKGWRRNGPLRILYTITRFLETEELPVLEAEVAMPQPQPSPAAILQTPPSPQTQLQQLRMQHQQHHHQHPFPHGPPPPFGGIIVINEDGSQHILPYPMIQQHDHEGLLRMSTPPGMQAPPSHHISPQHHHHFMGPPPQFMGGASMAPPPHGQMTSSIFPSGHVIVEHSNGSHIVSANMSVESALSNPATIRKRQRMAPKRMRDRDALMASRGIEKGATLMSKGVKMELPFGMGNLPGISAIRMPVGCSPHMFTGVGKSIADLAGLPIEATTIDGKTHATTLRELPILAKSMVGYVPAAAAVPPPSMLTPEERVLESIDTLPVNDAAINQHLQAERRASDASSASNAVAAEEADDESEAPPQLAPEDPSEEGEDAKEDDTTPPPVLDASETPDSPRSLEIDEMMDEVSAPPPPSSFKGIPA